MIEHEHEWIDARNPVVKSGWYCNTCGVISRDPATHDDKEHIRRLGELSQEGRRLLEANPGDPAGWPDAAKLELIALHFDAVELGMPSPLDWEPDTDHPGQVQADLRRIAGQIATADYIARRWVEERWQAQTGDK